MSEIYNFTAKDVIDALELHRKLQSREINPDGHFDSKKRWFPSKEEEQDCCRRLRRPSSNYPYTLMSHCRSLEHVAHACNLPPYLLRQLHYFERRGAVITEDLLTPFCAAIKLMQTCLSYKDAKQMFATYIDSNFEENPDAHT